MKELTTKEMESVGGAGKIPKLPGWFGWVEPIYETAVGIKNGFMDSYKKDPRNK